MHPAGRNPVQHGQRLVDQIVIVEQAALLLLAPVVRRRGGCDVQQRLGAVAGRHRAALLDQGDRDARSRRRNGCRCRDFSSRKLFVTTVRAGFLASVRNMPRYSSTCAVPVERLASRSRAACFWSALLPVDERRGGSLPHAIAASWARRQSRARRLRCFVSGHAERRRHLRRGGFDAAGGVGPCHEMIAAQAGLAHDVLEGHVGGVRHRGLKRAAGRRCRDRGRLRAAPSDWRAPSFRSGRARRAPQSAPGHWLRTEIAAAAACTARGWSAPSIRPASPARRRTVCAPPSQASRRVGDAGFARSHHRARRRRA